MAISGYQILLISKSECGLHIGCNFGGHASFRWSFLKDYPKILYSKQFFYDGRGCMGTIVESGGLEPASVATKASDAAQMKIATYDESQVAISGGGGNCTRVPISVTICPACGYDMALGGWPEHGRDDAALRELVAAWHGLATEVREKIIDVGSGHRLTLRLKYQP